MKFDELDAKMRVFETAQGGRVFIAFAHPDNRLARKVVKRHDGLAPIFSGQGRGANRIKSRQGRIFNDL